MYNVSVFLKEDDSIICSANLADFDSMEIYAGELESNKEFIEQCYIEVEVIIN